MIPEERNSYTLTEEEAIIFATAKFKPFHNRLEEDTPQPNPFKKLVENEKINHQLCNIFELTNYEMEDEFLLKLIRRNISKFKTSSNPSIASYLQDKALSLNKQNSIRTYLLIDSDTSELIGYFCLKIVIIKFEINVSKNIKKKISSDAMKTMNFHLY